MFRVPPAAHLTSARRFEPRQPVESFRLPAVGSISFSPLPLLGFIKLLVESVEEAAASVS
jgi:hypothetical protein